MTLDPSITERVRALLDKGCGYNQVARLLNGQVSRSKVAQIAHAPRPPTPDRPPPEDPDDPLRPYHKCPGCNYRVQMPCLICRARAHRHSRIKRRRRQRLPRKQP